jgi:hypothetical protein
VAFPADSPAEHERVVVSVHPHWYGLVRPALVALDMPINHIGEVESHSFIVENLFGCGTLAASSRDGRGRVELPRMPNVRDVGLTLHRLAHGAAR